MFDQLAGLRFDVNLLCRKGIPSVNVNTGEIAEPLELPLGGNGRVYGITSVGEYCPRGRPFFSIVYPLYISVSDCLGREIFKTFR